jgi:hypothetical protein
MNIFGYTLFVIHEKSSAIAAPIFAVSRDGNEKSVFKITS